MTAFADIYTVNDLMMHNLEKGLLYMRVCVSSCEVEGE